ncbi:MAG: carboxypeptidase regulatory-like domain-containing protein [Bacteroidetes bacterium]|nr:carboxypeptidase regulatory-like domain-containing protein [Bacteroidota bacterium]MCW5895308.1 carboxypeptidase regulatory-like domain-containing protein [Bacteroidota bacterium]
MKAGIFIGCLTLTLVAPGCMETGINNGIICTTEARAGIQIDIRDSLSGQPAAIGATVVVQHNTYIDTLRGILLADSLTVSGAYERPGIYTIIITKSGYVDWIRPDVVVNKDECHVITVRLEARLERVP